MGLPMRSWLRGWHLLRLRSLCLESLLLPCLRLRRLCARSLLLLRLRSRALSAYSLLLLRS